MKHRYLFLLFASFILGACKSELPPCAYPVDDLDIKSEYLYTILLDHPARRRDEIIDLVENMGGLVVSSKTRSMDYDGDGIMGTNVELRLKVPKSFVDKVYKDAIKGSVIIVSEEIRNHDTSDRQIEAEERLNQMKSQKSSLLTVIEVSELSISEMRDAENELAELEGQISSLERRIEDYRQEVEFPNIYLSLYPMEASAYFVLPVNPP